MTIIKFIKRLLFTRKIIHEIAPDVTVGLSHTGHYYSEIKDRIYFDVFDDPAVIRSDYGFIRHIKECHLFNVQPSYYLVSVLHEIGHHMTGIEDTEDDLYKRTLCAMIPAEEADRYIDIQNIYFNITSEWEATEWAINWIKNNKELFTYYSNKLE